MLFIPSLIYLFLGVLVCPKSIVEWAMCIYPKTTLIGMIGGRWEAIVKVRWCGGAVVVFSRYRKYNTDGFRNPEFLLL
jgi:hypothetical protein